MTARPLTVIPPKCTGVPITQPEKIILMYKSFFLIFKKKIFLLLLKPFLISISIFKKKKKNYVIKCFFNKKNLNATNYILKLF
jgi:hypothetical protein